jgi:uncharacterized protein YciI
MEYIYILKLVERLEKVDNWTNKDNNIVGEHFNNLLNLKEKGILLLAGKTAGNDHDTFGVVIFKADSFEEAEKIMLKDPAIKKGIMTAKLWEYNVALLNKEYKND